MPKNPVPAPALFCNSFLRFSPIVSSIPYRFRSRCIAEMLFETKTIFSKFVFRIFIFQIQVESPIDKKTRMEACIEVLGFLENTTQ